jgi:2-hydroxycyclohexanecarboxyl-CoA dehydrogenase
MDLKLSGQTAVVTGGASGIGLACVRTLLAEGAQVAIWDLGDAGATAVRGLVDSDPAVVGRAMGCTVDVTRSEQVAEAVTLTETKLGPIEVLVHAAAIGSGKFGFPYTNLSPEDWLRVLDVDVMGMVRVAHEVGPRMRDRRRGAMVFIASVAGQMGSQTDPPYSAAKAANINFAQCLAKDLAPHNVRVNSVCPGMVQTPLNRSVWQAWFDQAPVEQRRPYEEWAAAKIRQVVPLGRWQTPEAVADMIVFLASPRADHITGQTINVDGGFVMHS